MKRISFLTGIILALASFFPTVNAQAAAKQNRTVILSNMDVAPTMAAVLGLEMKDVDGRVLKEILE